MTDKELADIRERLEKATPGPWEHTHKDCKHFMSSDFVDRKGDDIGVGLVTSDINQDNADLYATDADMEFIAHARQDVPILLAEVERLQAELDKWQRANTAAHKMAAQW